MNKWKYIKVGTSILTIYFLLFLWINQYQPYNCFFHKNTEAPDQNFKWLFKYGCDTWISNLNLCVLILILFWIFKCLILLNSHTILSCPKYRKYLIFSLFMIEISLDFVKLLHVTCHRFLHGSGGNPVTEIDVYIKFHLHLHIIIVHIE
jgi:hypothetical protein